MGGPERQAVQRENCKEIRECRAGVRQVAPVATFTQQARARRQVATAPAVARGCCKCQRAERWCVAQQTQVSVRCCRFQAGDISRQVTVSSAML